MVASLLRLAPPDWPVPDSSTLCRPLPGRRFAGKSAERGEKTLAVQIPYRRADGPLNLFAPLGQCCAIPCRAVDSPVLPELPDQIPGSEERGTVTADSACDIRRCHTAIIARQASAVIPTRKNGRPWKEDCPAERARNETLRATRHSGRAFWRRLTAYHARSRIKARMRGPWGLRRTHCRKGP